MLELFEFLYLQTPFLAAGLLVNLYISIVAMIIGTIVGTIVAIPIARNWYSLNYISKFSVNISRNVPSFVLMFYIAFLLPNEISILGSEFSISPEIKAALALVFPVLGFAADQFLGFVRSGEENGGKKIEIYVSSWIQYFLIILMASVTASVIGADEVLSRANRLISTRNDLNILVGTYVYICIWFVLIGFISSLVFKKLASLIPAD